MATMNISLPDSLKAWAEQHSREGQYRNTSDYVRDLIRKDQQRLDKVAHMQKLVDEGFASGVGKRSMSDIREQALAIAEGRAEYSASE